MSELQPGMFLGRYELLVRIGRGGMASVWVTRERSAVSGKQRLVAVKAMLPELARHSEFRSMFLDEVQIIQSIQHDNVVRVFEVSEDKDILYMAMEWVEGDSLRNIIRASKGRGALPPEIAVCVAADAASGLHAAHDLRDWDGELRGVVHCDVSPHNILVGLDGKAKLVDFGIANAMGRLERSGDAETIKGKLSYMSPEQARGEKVDRRTDVFALGIVLFEMTTGEQLFKGRDVAHTLELVKSVAIPRPSRLNRRYPLKLEQIVLKALERDPRNRFQTAEEFEFVLSSYLTEEHTVVSHPVVARLLTQLLGARIEKRREVITTVINAIDSNRPVGSLAGRSSIFDIPVPTDTTSHTLTGHSESGLGIAARLEDLTTAAVPISNRPSAPVMSNATWRWIGAFGLLAGVVIAIVYYFYVVRPSQAEAAAIQQADTSESDASTAAVNASNSAQPGSSARRTDKALSIENLPVDHQGSRDVAPAIGGRWRKARKGDPSAETNPSDNGPQPADIKLTDESADKPTAQLGIDRAAANAALASAAAAARSCRSQGEPPSPTGRAAVSFAPDGSVSAVSISQNYIGTPIGYCVMSHYKNARAPAFVGDTTTLFSTFDMSK
jgi:eukaryotic-like serine/threonine-protein kinase